MFNSTTFLPPTRVKKANSFFLSLTRSTSFTHPLCFGSGPRRLTFSLLWLQPFLLEKWGQEEKVVCWTKCCQSVQFLTHGEISEELNSSGMGFLLISVLRSSEMMFAAIQSHMKLLPD